MDFFSSGFMRYVSTGFVDNDFTHTRTNARMHTHTQHACTNNRRWFSFMLQSANACVCVTLYRIFTRISSLAKNCIGVAKDLQTSSRRSECFTHVSSCSGHVFIISFGSFHLHVIFTSKIPGCEKIEYGFECGYLKVYGFVYNETFPFY